MAEEHPCYCSACWQCFNLEMTVKESLTFFNKNNLCPICKEGRIHYCYPPGYTEDTAHERKFTVEIEGKFYQVTRYRWHELDTRADTRIYIAFDRVFLCEISKSLTFTNAGSLSEFEYEGVQLKCSWNDDNELSINGVLIESKQQLEEVEEE